MFNCPGSRSATNFSTLSVAKKLIPRPKIQSLTQILTPSRRQNRETPYLGRDGKKMSRGGQKISRHD